MKHLLLLMVFAVAAYGATKETEPGKAQMVKGKYVIDVRTEAEWNDGHIDGAVLIPYNQIKNRIAEVTKDKNAAIALYCASGGRSGRALLVLRELGYKNVENLGGFEDAKEKFNKSK